MIRLLLDRVLIRELPGEESVINGGLIISPDSAQLGDRNGIRRGVVIATGPGDKLCRCSHSLADHYANRGESMRCARANCRCRRPEYAGAIRPMSCAPGETVLFWRQEEFDGSSLGFALGEKYHIIHEEGGLVGVIPEGTHVRVHRDSIPAHASEGLAGSRREIRGHNVKWDESMGKNI